jgi:hypothetical protein
MKIIPPEYEKYRRKDGKIYFIYRVDDISSGSFYIGSRCNINIHDNYYGSPSHNNKYKKILTESKKNNYNNLIFTIIKWTTKQKRYIHEEEILQMYKKDNKILNKYFKPTLSCFCYEKGDTNNPFIKHKEKLSKVNTLKNKSWAGIYQFTHPEHGNYTCTITDLINTFKQKNIILDRGMMNLIARYGHLRNGWPKEYKRSNIPINKHNKYYNWSCVKVIKQPYLRCIRN